MAVQASWNLDSTADSLIGISRNALAAATTDDVSPIALLACEKFGTSLAMSQETIHKIQVSVVPTPSPAILNFFKVSVGYKANDCVNYFGQNTAGLHFLGLACALVTMDDQYKAATMLQNMLDESSTDDKRLLPTTRSLQKLLAALGPRCHRSGFTDETVGWNLLFTQHPKLLNQRETLRAAITAPEGDALSNVVDALRQLNRLGNADITGITIKTAKYATWFAAFVKWSIGYPPSVVCTDGSSIIQQPGSKVAILIPLDDKEASPLAVSVTVYSSVHGPSELIVSSLPISSIGMISLPMYGKALLRHLDLTSVAAQSAFLEAMPYALSLIIHIVQTKGIRHFRTASSVPWAVEDIVSNKSTIQPPTDVGQAVPLCPFPDRTVISEVFEMLFDVRIELLPCKEWVDIFALQNVALYVAQCSCSSNCAKEDGHYSIYCLKSKFANVLGRAVQDVLALSLINNPEDLLVSSLPRFAEYSHYQLVFAIQAALCAERTSSDMSALKFAEEAFKLLGRNATGDIVQDQVLSSFRGQVVWPTIYETMDCAKHGFLSLSWHSGQILYKNDTFESAKWFKHRNNDVEPFPDRREGIAVAGPCNLYSDARVEWAVAVDFAQLHMKITLANESMSHMRPCFGQHTLKNLEKVVLVEQCPHHRDTELHCTDKILFFTGPFKPSNPRTNSIYIVAVDNDEKLRFIAIDKHGGEDVIMVRGRACINCCINQCQNFGSQVLVL